MMQNLLVSSLTPLQTVDEINSWVNQPFSGVWPQSSCKKLTEVRKTMKKKPKRIRTAYTTEQLRALEHLFTQNKYITAERRSEISKNLNIGDKSVKIWFQNRRMKEKRLFSESSSDSSNETLASELYPSVEKELLNSESFATKANMEHVYTPDSCQYQVRNYTNNEPVDNSYAPSNLTTNSMQFYNNNSVYPTQYYPYNENNLNYNYNYFQYQHNNEMYNNYLSSNNVESPYFYN